MDSLNDYRRIVRDILTDLTRVPYSIGDLQSETVFDRDADRYLALTFGRDHDRRRVHFCLAHIDIIDGKLWVHCDNTDAGVVQQLLDAGVPKDRIVLGFKPPELRQHTGFAVA